MSKVDLAGMVGFMGGFISASIILGILLWRFAC